MNLTLLFGTERTKMTLLQQKKEEGGIALPNIIPYYQAMLLTREFSAMVESCYTALLGD